MDIKCPECGAEFGSAHRETCPLKDVVPKVVHVVVQRGGATMSVDLIVHDPRQFNFDFFCCKARAQGFVAWHGAGTDVHISYENIMSITYVGVEHLKGIFAKQEGQTVQ